jgi:hypothetical protein
MMISPGLISHDDEGTTSGRLDALLALLHKPRQSRSIHASESQARGRDSSQKGQYQGSEEEILCQHLLAALPKSRSSMQ